MLGMQLQNVARRSTSDATGASIIDIASLFSPSDTGCFYDLNDMSTLKEDIAGTTAASIDNPVGKILDKHSDKDMVAPNSTDRGTLRRKAKDTPKRNKQVKTEITGIFSSVANMTHVTSTTSSSPLGYQSRNIHTLTVTGSGNVVPYGNLIGAGFSGTNQTISFYAKITSAGSTPCEGIYLLNNVGNTGSVLFDFDTETVTGTDGDLVSGSITAVASHTGWYKCVATVPAHTDFFFFLLTDGSSNYLNGVSPNNVVKIQGFQRENGNTSTDYQAVYTSSYEEYGIANVNYLSLTADGYVTQNFAHDSQDLVMFSRVKTAAGSGQFIWSTNTSNTNNSYRLYQNNSKFLFEVGATGGNNVQADVPTGIPTIRAEYIGASDSGKMYLNGTLANSNNFLNSSATDFGLFSEASLGAKLTQGGSTPTVSNQLSGDLYSFVLFNKQLTDTQKQNIEHTLRSQTGDA